MQLLLDHPRDLLKLRDGGCSGQKITDGDEDRLAVSRDHFRDFIIKVKSHFVPIDGHTGAKQDVVESLVLWRNSEPVLLPEISDKAGLRLDDCSFVPELGLKASGDLI